MKKKCITCKESKPIEKFHLDPQRLDGRCLYCAECRNKRVKELYNGAEKKRYIEKKCLNCKKKKEDLRFRYCEKCHYEFVK